MNELKVALDRAIDDYSVDLVLKALAEVLSNRANKIRGTGSEPVKQHWKDAAYTVDHARMSINI